MSVKVLTFLNNNPPQCDDEWLNSVVAEVNNTISGTGQTLPGSGTNPPDQDQLAKAIADYSANGDFYTDSGVADAYVLSVIGSKQGATSIADGMRVRFLPGNTNSGGAATVNPNGLGATPIKQQDGTTDPAAGDLTAGREVILQYRNSDSAFIIGSSATTGNLLSVQTFTASGTWNRPAGVNQVVVEAIGGGGGGANRSGGSGGGAGGGGYSKRLITSGLGASQTVTVGTGGAGATVANTSGAGGNTSSFGAFITATGGGGGISNGTGGTGGIGASGDINSAGDTGNSGDNSNIGGDGGGTAYGGGGIGRTTTIVGNNGVAYGGGGAGGFNANGGNGADGIVIVWEYS